MKKEEVVRKWQPELRELGFVYQNGYFQLKETLNQHIRLSILIQRYYSHETFFIYFDILLLNPLIKNSEPEVFLRANVRKDGLYFHIYDHMSLWPPKSLPKALSVIKREIFPWFEQFGNPHFLLEKVELANKRQISLVEAFEPLTREEESNIQNVWPSLMGDRQHGPAPQNLYFASVLYYLVGNRQNAIRRTQDWLSHLSPEDSPKYSSALEQLSKLSSIQALQ